MSTLREQSKRVSKLVPSWPKFDMDLDLTVSWVSPDGPADVHGIVAGDRLCGIDGQPIRQEQTDDLEATVLAGQTFHFQIKSNGAQVTLDMQRWSPGITLGLSPDAAETQGGSIFDDEGLYELWQEKAWDTILKITQKRLKLNLFWRGVLRLKKRPPHSFPVFLMNAVSRYESGDHRAIEDIDQYGEFEHYNTVGWYAIRRYYLAKESVARGDAERALDFLREAWEHDEAEPIGDLYFQLTGERLLVANSWVGLPMPGDLMLETLDGQPFQLSERISKLGDGQLLSLCLLGPYRANGPYQFYISRFIKRRSLFSGLLSESVTITESADVPEAMGYDWADAERKGIAAGEPITVVYDEEDEASSMMEITNAPSIYLINRDGKIIGDGLDENSWWTAMNELFAS